MRSATRSTIVSPPQFGIEMVSLAVKTNCTSLSDGKCTDVKAVNNSLTTLRCAGRYVTADGHWGTINVNIELVHTFV